MIFVYRQYMLRYVGNLESSAFRQKYVPQVIAMWMIICVNDDVQSLKIIFVIVIVIIFVINENNVVSAKSHLN